MYRYFVLMFTFLTTMALFSEAPLAFGNDNERYTTVRILSAQNKVNAGDEITIATDIKLKPKWHVYWRNPGDSGLPVRIDWDLPEGFEISDIKWPVPDKISYDILVNYGYYDQVTLLQTLKVPATLPDEDLKLKAKINMLVCNDICIPEADELTISLNVPNVEPADHSAYIEKARQSLPGTIKGVFAFSEEKAETEQSEKTLKIVLTPENRVLLADATEDNLEFFPYDLGIINPIENPDVTIEDGTFTLSHARGEEPLPTPDRISGILVIKGDIGENTGFEVEVLAKEGSKEPVAMVNIKNTESHADLVESTNIDEIAMGSTEHLTFLPAILFAFLGGLVLNLMPCVFPILSMKALSLIKMGDKEQKTAQLHGLSYTFGIILSFVIIAGALIILKETGSVIGWGFQLQNPAVIAFLTYILFLIGLNLIGFFEFSNRLSNVGQNLTQGHGLHNSFFTGALATIVATPCTAPFMAPAIGYALTQPAISSLSIFIALGFGLALPYLLLSFFPTLRGFLPKPGAWMNTFKQFLAFPMFASAIWLIWVLNQQAGSNGVALLLCGMLAITFGIWLSHLAKNGMQSVLKILALAFLILPLLSIPYFKTMDDAYESDANIAETVAFGEAFSHTKLDQLLKGDQPIFVEMTAAWCITCKLNHALAINTAATKKLFAKKDIQYLIGDWTNYDPEITNYLAAFERNGVPIYVYYGPRNMASGQRPDAVVLPQLLTPAAVRNTINGL